MNSLIKNILVYIDGTEQSITAAQYAICLAKSANANLVATYIINTKALDDLLKASIFLKDESIEYERDLHADADRYLNHIKKLADSKSVNIETVSGAGSIYQEVITIVKDHEIDLLIIGELSRIRSRRDEFYDDNERAMRLAPCSVLIVKDEDLVWEQFSNLS